MVIRHEWSARRIAIYKNYLEWSTIRYYGHDILQCYTMKSLKIPKGYQNQYIEEDQTTQWPKEKVQKDKQRTTKHTHKTKDRVILIPLKTGGEFRCSRMVLCLYSYWRNDQSDPCIRYIKVFLLSDFWSKNSYSTVLWFKVQVSTQH